MVLGNSDTLSVSYHSWACFGCTPTTLKSPRTISFRGTPAVTFWVFLDLRSPTSMSVNSRCGLPCFHVRYFRLCELSLQVQVQGIPADYINIAGLIPGKVITSKSNQTDPYSELIFDQIPLPTDRSRFQAEIEAHGRAPQISAPEKLSLMSARPPPERGIHMHLGTPNMDRCRYGFSHHHDCFVD
jgi:hypothetical protein